jgi:FHA domain/Double zinc ribbon
MIFCAQCSHENPNSATHCEACYAALPMTCNCTTCGAEVLVDASFCGQCGAKLRSTAAAILDETIPAERDAEVMVIPGLGEAQPLQPLDSIILDGLPTAALPEVAELTLTADQIVLDAFLDLEQQSSSMVVSHAPQNYALASSSPQFQEEPLGGAKTQLQARTAYLLHLQTNTMLAVPSGLMVVHIGKPNDRIPPDIDIAGFPHSEVVSRIHADLRVEGDVFFLEDVGSANGTYVNNLPLPPGNRHRLRVGDRIAFGKGNLVTFLFQLS